MVEMKLVISVPKTGRAYQVTLDESKCRVLIGKKIGDIVPGDPLGFPGYEFEIRGGTDKDGFPMRPDIHGGVRRRVLLSGPPGFHPKRKGERRKKTVRGNTITEDIVQVNVKVIKEGPKPIEELVGATKEKEEGEE
ncbi:MAG: 30S ribosomal protein S6e [Candidatus Baldrarchaeia archaeon]